MRRPDRRFRSRSTVLLSGWLFADLLLGLTVIFLAANTVGFHPQAIATPIPPTPTATPSPTPTPTPTPIPKPKPILDLNKKTFTLTIDGNGLLNDSSTARADLENQIRSEQGLRGRTAGLVIVLVGTPDDSSISTAQAIDEKVNGVLQTLGSQGFVFTHTQYYDHDLLTDLYTFGSSESINDVTIDVYLFAQ